MRTALLYGAAAVVYIGFGVWHPTLLISGPGAFAYLIAFVWGVPALVRRLRR